MDTASQQPAPAPAPAPAAGVPPQQIFRARRDYNRWVASASLEDYALRFTARSGRRFSEWQVGNTAFGAASFLVLEAVGADMLLHAGFQNSVWAILLTGILIFLIGLPICVAAARHGVDMDLLTRGAGFGYVGSTLTSLVYAAFTFLLFALEAAIMAFALQLSLGVPPWLGYIFCALVVIPLVTHGVSAITRLQAMTQPIWLALLVLPYLGLFRHDPGLIQRAWHEAPAAGIPTGLDPLLIGAAMTVGIALITQIAEQADYLRFMPQITPATRLRWWGAVMLGGPGWVLLGVAKMWGGALLAWLALRNGLQMATAADPNHLYLLAFRELVEDPRTAIWLTAALVLVSQIKINVTNAYAGSIAWSNFFARMTHSHPGRVVWVVFNVLIALMLMEMEVFQMLGQVLGIYSSVAIAWMAAVAADLVVSKPMGWSPAGIEFKRAALYDINPVGTGAMGLATVAALCAHVGWLGSTLRGFAPLIALAVAFVAAPLFAWCSGGRWYLVPGRQVPRSSPGAAQHCVICEQPYEGEDISLCPAYAGPICSLCCALDARCHDLCKPEARLGAQWEQLARRIFLARWQTLLHSGLAEFLLLFALAALALGVLMMLTLRQQGGALPADLLLHASLQRGLGNLYAALLLFSAVLCWWLVLARQSRQAAQTESNQQTARLMQEIASHQQTDQRLQDATELAEAANRAKSRYIVAVSHELRTPLNSLLGYAQLLGDDPSIPPHRRRAVSVIRESGDHLLSVIDHTLDIARIESGRLTLQPSAIDLPGFIQGIVHMFEMQAVDKGLEFVFSGPADLPPCVRVDARRLRQVLINILGNAIKFTQRGRVCFLLRYERQMAHIEISDTGPGIPVADQLRIFEPFQQGGDQRVPSTGTGVGLTIARMLTDLMGGRLELHSEPGVGSRFHVQLFLPEVSTHPDALPDAAARVIAYRGRRRRLLIVDDEPHDREFLLALLRPLGFLLATAASGAGALALLEGFRPDLILLDLEMPVMNGWDTLAALRRGEWADTPVAVLSAHGLEPDARVLEQVAAPDYLVKPLRVQDFLRWLGQRLALDWVLEPAETTLALPAASSTLLAPQRLPPASVCERLQALVREGYVRGIERELDRLAQQEPAWNDWLDSLRPMVAAFQFERLELALARMAQGGERT